MRALTTLLILTLSASPVLADLDSLRTEVGLAAAAGETDIAIDKLRQVLALAPDDGASHYQLATLLMDNNGDLSDAVKHFEHARDLEFQPMGVAYRLSRTYARTGRTNKALEQMEVLAAGGFGLLGYIDGESDYDGIRDTDRFSAAVAAITESRYPCMGDARRHAFDFWIGQWTVTSNGQTVGNASHGQ